MVRRDGLVKVLDFGLAKLEEWPAVTPESGPESAIENAGTDGRQAEHDAGDGNGDGIMYLVTSNCTLWRP